ncbi:MAG: BtpA/SgcQ family protein [Sphaerochaetaceae bacterium]|nr:BtpA/SgcQ family protein [Sphaerochaetaceae bacterium]
MKKIYGMVNLMALPGSFSYGGQGMRAIIQAAVEEAEALHEAGFTGFLVQNMQDGPVKQTASPSSVAATAVVTAELTRRFPDMEIGVLLTWDGIGSLAVAAASGASFIRVEHGYTRAEMAACGMIEAQCAEVCTARRQPGMDVPVYADVFEPHGEHIHPCPLETALQETVNYAHADGIFLCGKTFQESLELVRRARKAIPGVPIIIGGGVKGENAYEAALAFDGICVGAWIKDGNLANRINLEKAKHIAGEVKRAEAR